MLIKMLKEFSYKLGTGSTRTLPIGWAGEVSDKVGKRAIKGRFDKGNGEYVDGGYAVEVGGALDDDDDGEGANELKKKPAEAALAGAGSDDEMLRQKLIDATARQIDHLMSQRDILKKALLESGAAADDVLALIQQPDDPDLFEKVVTPLIPVTADNEIPSGIKPDADQLVDEVPEEPTPAPVSADHADFETLTIAELKGFLEGENVTYDAKAKHAELVDLCVGTLNK